MTLNKNLSRRILILTTILAVTSITSYAMPKTISNDENWDSGYFYDLSGNKNAGYIGDFVSGNMQGPNSFFLFKRDLTAEPVQIFAKFISSFVVAQDSFVVSDSKILKASPFVKVGVTNNRLKLYISYLPRQTPDIGIGGGLGFLSVGAEGSFSYTKKKYYYGTNADSLTQLTRKEFISVMSQVMADKPEVVAKIKSKKYIYGELEDLLKYYYTGKEPGYNDN